MRTPDGEILDLDPFTNPQEAILRAEREKLQAQGVRDPAAWKARLMSMLRARREFQNSVAHTDSLCLKPNGAVGARRFTAGAPAGAVVLGTTDGFTGAWIPTACTRRTACSRRSWNRACRLRSASCVSVQRWRRHRCRCRQSGQMTRRRSCGARQRILAEHRRSSGGRGDGRPAN